MVCVDAPINWPTEKLKGSHYTLDQSCLIVVAGINETDGRFTMIYDLEAFLPGIPKVDIRAAMLRLTEGGYVTGCNDGECRGDWTLNYERRAEMPPGVPK